MAESIYFNSFAMETLSCNTPRMDEKEMWVYVLAYNLIRMIMLQSALCVDVWPRSPSFKHTLQPWLAAGDPLIDTASEESAAEFMALAIEQTVGNRPGRVEPRAIKQRTNLTHYM